MNFFLYLSSNNDSSGFILAGPFLGVVFFIFIYLKYRNTNKNYKYEQMTEVKRGRVTGEDSFKGKKNGQSSSRIRGCNSADLRERVNRIEI
jgi:Na+/melibiose symporter-like transporter